MSVIRRMWGRFGALFRSHDLDQEFEQEALLHIELATDDYVHQGIPVHEAQRLARVKFGSLAASKDVHRDSRGLPFTDFAGQSPSKGEHGTWTCPDWVQLLMMNK